MENFEEIQELVEVKKVIEKSIVDCGLIAVVPESWTIAIKNSVTGFKGDNLYNIALCLGKDNLDELVSNFAVSVHAALLEAKAENEKKLSKYQIVKK